MNTELTIRRRFSLAQVIVSLVAPLLYVETLTTFSFATMSLEQLGYWLVLPAACFLGLSFAALLRREERFLVSRSGLWGVAIAGYLCMALPAALLLVASATYTGGGANIGLA